jgi:hypothetical protein
MEEEEVEVEAQQWLLIGWRRYGVGPAIGSGQGHGSLLGRVRSRGQIYGCQ